MIGLFGMWNSTTYNCEVKCFGSTIVIERPFASKTQTLSIVEAEQLRDALLIVIAEAKSG